MKRFLFSLLLMGTILAFTGCGNSEIEMTSMTGEIITISTEGLSEEQIATLESIANGEMEMMQLMRSELFTEEELMEYGLFSEEARQMTPEQGNAKGDIQIDMDSLNLDGLSDDQIEAIQKVVDGEMTMQELLESDILTPEDLESIGLGNENMMRPNGERESQGKN